MRKLILLLSYIAIAASGAMAQTFVVDDLGGDCNAWYYDVANDPAGTQLSGTLNEAIYRHREGVNVFDRIEFAPGLDGQVKNCGNSQFQINQPNLTIDATGVDITINSGGGNVFEIAANNISIIGLTFTGGGNAISVANASGATVQDISISGVNRGIQVSGSSNNVTLDNVTITGATQQGIQFNNYSGSGSVVTNSTIANSGEEGILVGGTGFSDLTISDSYVYGSQNSGININGGSAITINGNTIGIDENGNVSPNGASQDMSIASWGGIPAYGYSPATINIEYSGIYMDGSSAFTIGDNVVSGNDGHGVYVVNSQNTASNKGLITGNKVGVNEAGTEPVGNYGEGILVQSSTNVIIGQAGSGNHVVANGNRDSFVGGGSTAASDGAKTSHMHGHGIEVRESNTGIEVYGNIVGVSADGNSVTSATGEEFGNQLNGIYINGSSNVIVGDVTLGRNVVGGNGFAFDDVHTNDSDPANGVYLYGVRHGIQLHDATAAISGVQVKANLVGVGPDLVSPIKNSEDGISILGFGSGSTNNIIGGDDLNDGNIIGGGNYGIAFQGSGATNNEVYNNFIGVVALNGTSGIPTEQGAIKVQSGSSDNQIGDVGKGNILVNNNGLGVQIIDASATGNTIVGNIMSCNQLGGIGLQNGGNNDHGPVYVNIAEDRVDFVSGFTLNDGDRIDIYIAGDCFPTCQDDQSSNLGQGKTHVATVTAADIATSIFDNEFGEGYWELDISGITGATKNNIVVTSTDADGNTSEFNTCVTKVACNPPSTISLSSNTDKVICEGETTDINFSVTWPAAEVGEEHHYFLYKYDDYTTPVDTIISSDNTFPKTFTVADSGYYKVEAANLANADFCSLTTIDSVRVRVGEIPTPDNIVTSNTNDVCEDDLGKVYKVDSFEPGSTFIWNVEGASINGPANRDSVVIDFDGGSGTIKLWVKEVSGTPFACQSTDSTLLEIDVNPLPVPVIVSPNPAECAADTIVYRVDNADPNSNFTWTVTGGTELSSAADSIEVIWGTGVTGNVSVEETSDAGCIGTSSTTTVTINPRPVKPILTNTGSVCTLDDFVAEISNPGTRTFDWEITGGTPLSATGNPVTITADGNPTDSIRINVISTTSNGCSSIEPDYFAIGLNQRPVPGDISINPGLEACEADTITISYTKSSSTATTIWSSTPASFLANNAIGAFQGKETFQVVVAESASISVSEISTENCGTNPDSVKTVAFTMNANPVAPTLSGLTSVTCADSTTAQTYNVDNFDASSTYLWSFNNVRNSTVATDGSSADVTYGIRSYGIKVVETSDKGCSSDSASLSVNVIGCIFEADFEIDGGGTEACFDDINGVDFVDQSEGVIPGSTTYLWDFDINSDATSTPATSTDVNPSGIIYNAPGTYTVRLIIEDFVQGVTLKDTADIQITINDLPSISTIAGPDAVCEGDSGIFSVTETSGSSYTWTFPSTWTKVEESSPADSLTILFPRNVAQSGDISVREVNKNGCELTLTKPITVNTSPVSGGIITFDTDKCVGDTVTLNYNGAGASYTWDFDGTTDASFVSVSTTNTVDVILGSTTSKVIVYATSNEGCSPELPNADTTLTPTETPNPADYQIDGLTSICENDTEDFQVLPTNPDLDYEWQERGHELVTNGDSQSETIRPVADQSDVAVFLSINGCRAKAPLVSDIIRKVPLPARPSVSGINNPFCEDSTVLMNYNAIDSLNYSWTLSPAAGVSLESSQNGIGLDSLKFVVNPKQDWNSPDCPGITASLNIEYTTLPSTFDVDGCSTSDSHDIPVRFRIDKANLGIAYMDFEDNSFGYFCNKFDSRSDQEAELRAVVECDNTVDELSFAWETYQVVDNNGTSDTVLVNIRTANSNGDSLEVDFDQTPMDLNRDYNYVFKYSALNPVCANDTGFAVNTLILEGSDTVDFKLEDNIICAEDTSSIRVKNILNDIKNPEIIYHYYYNLDTTTASYTSVDSLFRFVEGDTSQYLTYAEDGFVDVDSISHLINSTGNIMGYGYYLISETPLKDSISVRVEPKFCVVNTSMLEVQFTDSLYLNVVNRPGGSVGGIDYGTSTDFRGLTRDELFAENPNGVFPDELNLSQLEDNYVLLDAAENRDTNFVYASNDMIYYSWATLENDKYQAITDENSNVLIDKPNGMPEEINYAMVTSQIATGNDTVCTDTSYYKVTFEYIPWIPNIFSPNGDGNHDLFEIRNVEMYPETNVQIFNRWGSHLITIDYYDNKSQVWDGKVNGKDVSTGTYYYLVDFKVDGIDPVSGSVSVIR